MELSFEVTIETFASPTGAAVLTFVITHGIARAFSVKKVDKLGLGVAFSIVLIGYFATSSFTTVGFIVAIANAFVAYFAAGGVTTFLTMKIGGDVVGQGARSSFLSKWFS